jgi:hypothetical protein
VAVLAAVIEREAAFGPGATLKSKLEGVIVALTPTAVDVGGTTLTV